jgi:hypothetical protein
MWCFVIDHRSPNKSLDASGGSVFLNLLGAAKGALIRAAASTLTFGGFSHRSVVMDIVTQLFTSLCCLLLMASAASAKSWRGIEPLHSTRADVERLLGPPNVDRDLYDFPGERTSIWYSDGGCKAGLPSGWNVPKDTVVEIYSSLTEWKKLEDVLVRGKDYSKSARPTRNTFTMLILTTA